MKKSLSPYRRYALNGIWVPTSSIQSANRPDSVNRQINKQRGNDLQVFKYLTPALKIETLIT